MQFGVNVNNREPLIAPDYTLADLLDLTERVEALGFDSVWVGDSLFSKPRYEPIALLSAISQRTKQVKLGTACMVSGTRNPLYLALEWATLDHLSNGRTIFGTGMGNPEEGVRREYASQGMDFEKRAAIFEEGLAVLRGEGHRTRSERGDVDRDARLERDAPVLDVQSHALADWVRRAVDGVRASAASVTFQCEAPATAVSACFDDRFMTRALGNVLRNAARHARAEVRVSAAVTLGACVIHVDDDGPGVPASEHERIFEPFVRLDANRDGGGYGLGLAIARRILRWHDGDIAVHASPLGGARFSLRWPATPGHTSLP